MEISITDFNSLAEELSRRDVRIAQLEMEREQERTNHEREMMLIKQERDGLWGERNRLQGQLDILQTDFENMRFECHWMKQYILLSVSRVRSVFASIHDIKLLSAMKTFVLQVLPENSTAEQIAYANDVMEVDMSDERRVQVLSVTGNYNDIHDNTRVDMTPTDE